MQDSGIPAKFPIPFANNAGGSYIRTIPQASQIGITAGAASLHDGFPPLCFTPISGGGVPPFGQDMNGILNEISAWSQWFQAGGPIQYDAAFATAIGGYPNGAMLINATFDGVWVCTADNTTSNPDTGGANWRNLVPIVKYGTVTLPASGVSTSQITASFASAFPHACNFVTVVPQGRISSTGGGNPILTATWTASTLTVQGDSNLSGTPHIYFDQPVTVRYKAEGY